MVKNMSEDKLKEYMIDKNIKQYRIILDSLIADKTCHKAIVNSFLTNISKTHSFKDTITILEQYDNVNDKDIVRIIHNYSYSNHEDVKKLIDSGKWISQHSIIEDNFVFATLKYRPDLTKDMCEYKVRRVLSDYINGVGAFFTNSLYTAIEGYSVNRNIRVVIRRIDKPLRIRIYTLLKELDDDRLFNSLKGFKMFDDIKLGDLNNSQIGHLSFVELIKWHIIRIKRGWNEQR